MLPSQSSVRRQALRDPDVRLMLAVRDDDDAAAFEELVVRYQTRLVGLLEHIVGSRDQAEDLAQDVFLRVYRARKTYEPGAKFSTWLFTIANNVAANAARSRFRRREVSLRPHENESTGVRPMERMVLASSGQIPARQLDKAEMRDIVRLALTSLNQRQRMAVLLSKFEGMSYADIAETMEMSPQAIKSLLSRARVNLRAVLEPYLEHGDRPAAIPGDPGSDGDTGEESPERQDPNPKSQIPNLRSQIASLKSEILDLKSEIPDPDPEPRPDPQP